MVVGAGIDLLPTEVLEKIFTGLGHTDLASASLVSFRWRKVSQRLLRQKCLEFIPEDVLAEILSQQEYGYQDWATVWSHWLESEVSPTSGTGRSLAGWLLRDRPSSRLTVMEERIYWGDGNGWIRSSTITGGRGGQHVPRKLLIRDGGVADLVPVNFYSLLLSSGHNSLHFIDTAHPPRLQELRTDFSLQLGSIRTISVFGPRFCVRDFRGRLQILDIYYVGQVVRTAKIAELTPPDGDWLQWQLWQEKLICLMTNGTVVVYSLLTAPPLLMYRSEQYTAITYRNPSWIFRDVVFCSTLASRGLDSSTPHTYIYMSDVWSARDGYGHWFIGPVDAVSDEAYLEDMEDIDRNQSITASTPPETFSRLMRGFCLKKIYPGSRAGVEISCVALHRRLLLCGTVDGSLLLYQAEEAAGSRHSTSGMDYEGVPCLQQKVSEEPLSQVNIGFSGGVVWLYYLAGSRLAGLSLPSSLQFLGQDLEDMKCY